MKPGVSENSTVALFMCLAVEGFHLLVNIIIIIIIIITLQNRI